MIETGEITGITTADLYRDNLHASGPLGRYLAAVTNFAVLFHKDVRGLVPPAQFTQFGADYPLSLYETFNKVIWEVVTSDTDTGIADFNDDGYVSYSDFAIWQSAFGARDAGDTDGDGDTDGLDFLNWQRNFWRRNSWTCSEHFSGSSEADGEFLAVLLCLVPIELARILGI